MATTARPLRVLGVMTGTSCDGMDGACVEIGASKWRPLWSETAPYPASLRERVLAMQNPRAKLTTRELLELDRDLGAWYGSVLARWTQGRPSAQRPQVIANHGQTVAHFPAPRARGTTLQIGDATRVAQATGLTVVSGLRDGDMAAGGEGAPLLPLFHRRMAGVDTGVAIHNLGGISNFSYIDRGDLKLAFDTGPANLWIDAAVTRMKGGNFDRDGRLAARGEVDARAVRRVIKEHFFFAKKPPKSTGRDDYPFEYLLKRTRARGADLVATATAITASSIAEAYRRHVLARGWPLQRILFCGGGALNPTLLAWVQTLLPETRVSTTRDVGVDPMLVEAQGFAYFGYLSLTGLPLGGAWTGARGFGPPGQITPGENWDAVLKSLR
jgi:anhydro-N-acetylmuramic acid kinase